MRINSHFEPYLSLLVDILKQYKVKTAYLFGSVLTDRFDENSDIDLLVSFEDFTQDPLERGENSWNLQFALEDSLHREVDLINEASLKNPYFIKEVNETRYKIYG
ncbi:MAG: nucleotidyltransferase domain-containing protein [Bacteroidales bacterium]|nr:nucleotidyltransferase domain-containing protein [Bacteroidales bacterium]MDY6347670.1 nucleotidyltransferase domain-containing protein [Bacteroidales bacterium]